MTLYAEAARQFLDPRPQTAQPSMLDLMIASSKAIDLLEGQKIRHGIKVAVIAGHIGKQLRLPVREISSLVFAGLLHDVGLAQITSHFASRLRPGITEKDVYYAHALVNARVVGGVADNQWSQDAQHLLTTHPIAAAAFIESVELSGDIAEIIAAHHELLDGSGYPMGLKGDAIPLGARILAFADVVEAVMREVSGLTTRTHALESFLEIKAPGKFDPNVISAFNDLIFENPSAGEDFLRRLYSLDSETMLRELQSDRDMPLSGKQLLNIARAMGRLSDRLTPQFTGQHSENVARYAALIAHQLGVGGEQLGKLVIAGLLHDIGMTAVPFSVLMKADNLSAEEKELIQDHARYTEEILRGIPTFEDVTVWASEHHERLNASGYPCRKKDHEISLGGRILAIADVFDALTSPRPFRALAYEPMDAIPVIGQGRFRLFDNQLVSILRKVVLNMEVPGMSVLS